MSRQVARRGTEDQECNARLETLHRPSLSFDSTRAHSTVVTSPTLTTPSDSDSEAREDNLAVAIGCKYLHSILGMIMHDDECNPYTLAWTYEIPM